MGERSARGVPSLDDPGHLFPPDAGCEESPSCLRCPLPQCKYDGDPSAGRRARHEARGREMLAARRGGATIEELAGRYGLSKRSVYRVLGPPYAAKREEAT